MADDIRPGQAGAEIEEIGSPAIITMPNGSFSTVRHGFTGDGTQSFHHVGLDDHRNNVGITSAATKAAGQFNVWRNSIPADELPVGRRTTVGGVPFDFPTAGSGEPDNVCCEGQLVALPRGRFDWLYLLVAAERRVEDTVVFHFTDGSVDFEPLRVSDFWVAPPVFGEDEAFTTSVMHYPHHVQPGVSAMIWCQRVPVTRRAEVSAVRLPSNVAVHIFAATLSGSRS